MGWKGMGIWIQWDRGTTGRPPSTQACKTHRITSVLFNLDLYNELVNRRTSILITMSFVWFSLLLPNIPKPEKKSTIPFSGIPFLIQVTTVYETKFMVNWKFKFQNVQSMNEWMKIYKWSLTISKQNNVCSQRHWQYKNSINSVQQQPKLTAKKWKCAPPASLW